MQPPPCSSPVNLEPDIIAAYFPAKNESVGRGGQIKVWINDELPMMIAPNEVVDPTSGAIKTPGDRTAKASDGYLYEPMLYINGKAYFPTAIKGWYNNKSPVYGYIGQQVVGEQVQGMDPLPAGTQTDDMYTGEDIWEVNALGLAPGSYDAEFVIKDGDAERGLGCVRIVIN
jgi:hypothetical protein